MGNDTGAITPAPQSEQPALTPPVHSHGKAANSVSILFAFNAATYCKSVCTCARILTRDDEPGLEACRASSKEQPDACANLFAVQVKWKLGGHTACGLQILFVQGCGRWLAAAAHWQTGGPQGNVRRRHPRT